jgi:hypothetical protein
MVSNRFAVEQPGLHLLMRRALKARPNPVRHLAAPSHFASRWPIKSRIPRVGFIFLVNPIGGQFLEVTGAVRKRNRFGTVKATLSTAIMAGIALAVNQALERVVVLHYALEYC